MATKAAEKPSRSRTARSKPSSNVGAIAGAAAAGVTFGVLAMIGRKVAVQAPTFLAGEWDEALAAEHAAVLKLFDAIEATTDRNTIKRSILLAQLKHALAKHALEEENAVYPALRQIGEVYGADKLNKEHGYVKQYLYDLENLPNGSPAFLEKIRAFRNDIEHHMREEEDVLFPRLKSTLGDERNKQLTAAMNKEGYKLA
jgi:hemerythrin superfamily protein